MKLIDDWKKALEKRRLVGAILMDLSKAFDYLPHQLLVAKLKAYGVCGKSCALIRSYLMTLIGVLVYTNPNGMNLRMRLLS